MGVDAPQLARLGDQAVGVKTLHLVQHDQVDVLAFDAAKGSAPSVDRAAELNIDSAPMIARTIAASTW